MASFWGRWLRLWLPPTKEGFVEFEAQMDIEPVVRGLVDREL